MKSTGSAAYAILMYLRVHLSPVLLVHGFMLASSSIGVTQTDTLTQVCGCDVRTKYFTKECSDVLDSLKGGCTISIKYPFFTCSTKSFLADSLNSTVTKSITRNLCSSDTCKSIESCVTCYVEWVAKGLARETEFSLWGGEDRQARVTEPFPFVIAMTFEASGMTPFAAHPHGERYYVNVEGNSGKRISLNDIIAKGADSGLTEIARTALRELRDIPDTMSAPLNHWASVAQSLKLNENFSIEDTCLMFFYNDYEIAGYAEGSTKLILPYSKIHGYISAEGPLASVVRRYGQ